MLTPSAGSVLTELHSTAPPPPALYWTTVSMAGHFFFSTTCWCRAEMSDSPPGGKGCQYIRFLSGQVWACAAAAAARARAAIRVRVIREPPVMENSRRMMASGGVSRHRVGQ
jgi:hypothetical protein